jgi:hypothetical protein
MVEVCWVEDRFVYIRQVLVEVITEINGKRRVDGTVSD